MEDQTENEIVALDFTKFEQLKFRLLSQFNELERPEIEFAIEFAKERHGNQQREYTGEPYIVHPLTVALAVKSCGCCKDTVVAAILHDVLEDTETTEDEIEANFGVLVTDLVVSLTDCDLSVGNRAKRKEIDRLRIRRADYRAKNVKLSDLSDNLKTIVEHNPNFAVVYVKEISLLLDHLAEGTEPTLYSAAKAQFYQASRKLSKI